MIRGRLRIVSLTVVLWFGLASLRARPSHADEDREPAVVASVLSGVAVALVPTLVGSALVASGQSNAVRNSGLFLMHGGLVLGPLVSHGIVGEWKRAAVATSLPLAFTVAMAAVVGVHPDLAYDGSKDTRSAYVVLLAGAILTSAGGIIDSMLAGDRYRKRKAKAPKRSIAIAPMVGSVVNGIMIGGTL